MSEPDKKVVGSLVGVDGNAFALMGRFSGLAKRQGWSAEEIKRVLDEAKSGDYDNLVVTLDSYMEAG